MGAGKEAKLEIGAAKHEEWRTIDGFPSYAVSNIGNIKRTAPGLGTFPGRMRSLRPGRCGYASVRLTNGARKDTMLVHRIVAVAFVPRGRPDQFEVNHKNGIKTDNRAENLEWCSRSENVAHSEISGLCNHKNGSGHWCATLNEKIVTECRAERAAGVKVSVLAKRYQVGPRAIREAVSGKTWRHVS